MGAREEVLVFKVQSAKLCITNAFSPGTSQDFPVTGQVYCHGAQ